MRRPSYKTQNGFSIIELLASMTIAMVASAGFIQFNSYQMHAVQDQARQLAVQDMARSAIDIFAREVRRAGQNPTCAGGITPIVSASSSSLRFQADIDGNGVLAASNEDVTYRYNSGTAAFERLTNSLAEALVTGVTTTALFRYYDSVGTELVPSPNLSGTQLNNVRRIHVDLSLSTTTTAQNGNTLWIKSSAATNVNLRNRFFVSAVTCS